MMADSAVRERLLSLGAVTALVAQRVYTSILPQSPTLPAVLVLFVGENEDPHMRGSSGFFQTRVQVDCVAKSDAVAKDIDAAIHGPGDGTALAFWAGSVGSPPFEVTCARPLDARKGYEPEELRQFRVSRDYMVFHRGGYT